jgi:hypothetical protein
MTKLWKEQVSEEGLSSTSQVRLIGIDHQQSIGKVATIPGIDVTECSNYRIKVCRCVFG